MVWTIPVQKSDFYRRLIGTGQGTNRTIYKLVTLSTPIELIYQSTEINVVPNGRSSVGKCPQVKLRGND